MYWADASWPTRLILLTRSPSRSLLSIIHLKATTLCSQSLQFSSGPLSLRTHVSKVFPRILTPVLIEICRGFICARTCERASSFIRYYAAAMRPTDNIYISIYCSLQPRGTRSRLRPRELRIDAPCFLFVCAYKCVRVRVRVCVCVWVQGWSAPEELYNDGGFVWLEYVRLFASYAPNVLKFGMVGTVNIRGLLICAFERWNYDARLTLVYLRDSCKRFWIKILIVYVALYFLLRRVYI